MIMAHAANPGKSSWTSIMLKPRGLVMPLVATLIMTFSLASCIRKAGGAGGGTDGTFLVDDPGKCDDLRQSSGKVPEELESKVIAAVLSDSSYSSSSLVGVDLGAKKVCKVASGESGDTLLVAGTQGLVAFSRRAPQLNYSVFTPMGRTTQQATPLAGNGDPHGLLEFSSEGLSARWLMALNTAGKLVDFDPARPSDRTAVVPEELSSGLAATPEFRPVDMMLVRGDEIAPEALASTGGALTDEFILVLHQGLDQFYRGNGSQAIYAWQRTRSGQYIEADLNPSKAGINGWPLRLSNPSGFFRSGAKVSLLSLCFSADSACVKGVEQFELADVGSTKTPTVLTDFSGNAIFSNGGSVAGSIKSKDETRDFVFAATQQSSGKKISAIDLASGKVQGLHSFTGSSNGFFGLAFDRDSSSLIIGDSDGRQALLWVYTLDSEGRVKGSPSRHVLATAGQPFPMQFVILDKN